MESPPRLAEAGLEHSSLTLKVRYICFQVTNRLRGVPATCQTLERHPRGVTWARRAQPECWGGGEGAAESTVVRLLAPPYLTSPGNRMHKAGSEGLLVNYASVSLL